MFNAGLLIGIDEALVLALFTCPVGGLVLVYTHVCSEKCLMQVCVLALMKNLDDFNDLYSSSHSCILHNPSNHLKLLEWTRNVGIKLFVSGANSPVPCTLLILLLLLNLCSNLL